jgi:hypothetical protein
MMPPAHLSLDEGVPGLLLDALAPVETAVASAISGVPYAAIRPAIHVEEDHRRELQSAVEAVASNHPNFFAKYGSALEFVVSLMALNAARVDHLLVISDMSGAESGQNTKACSASQALAIGLVVLAPLVFLTLILIFGSRRG